MRRALVASALGLSAVAASRGVALCKAQATGADVGAPRPSPGTPPRLVGKTFVVTGGTSGVGEAVAMRLAREGCAGVTIVGRSEERGARVCAQLDELGCKALFVKADMASVADVQAVVPAHARAFGSLDGLVNCAGDTARGSIGDQAVEDWDRLFAVNARAPFLLTQAASNYMRETGTCGSIVNIITITSHGGQPYLCGYAASKGACVALTRNTAHALRHDRIRVNGINIGWTNSAAEHATQLAQGAGEDWLERAAARVPFGRLVEPADIAALAAYLLSPEAGVMTGAIIDMDQMVIGAYD
ncbi:hypothetical protein KFE25_012476 [Diacronema lutheri]|uniref:Ketoreductase domain-containing protein n=1 Tax=Diacronema lutheri TaxID=2081491 RepID=A0A8J6CEZ7_DIALT|nr:hypothetical protein KFE25_012476 [Diacronema lutheri]